MVHKELHWPIHVSFFFFFGFRWKMKKGKLREAGQGIHSNPLIKGAAFQQQQQSNKRKKSTIAKLAVQCKSKKRSSNVQKVYNTLIATSDATSTPKNAREMCREGRRAAMMKAIDEKMKRKAAKSQSSHRLSVQTWCKAMRIQQEAQKKARCEFRISKCAKFRKDKNAQEEKAKRSNVPMSYREENETCIEPAPHLLQTFANFTKSRWSEAEPRQEMQQGANTEKVQAQKKQRERKRQRSQFNRIFPSEQNEKFRSWSQKKKKKQKKNKNTRVVHSKVSSRKPIDATQFSKVA